MRTQVEIFNSINSLMAHQESQPHTTEQLRRGIDITLGYVKLYKSTGEIEEAKGMLDLAKYLVGLWVVQSQSSSQMRAFEQFLDNQKTRTIVL